jgi:hypothetical protein
LRLWYLLLLVGALLAQVFLDGVELALPQLALASHPRVGVVKRALLQAQAVGAPVDHANDRARFLEHLQVLADRGL